MARLHAPKPLPTVSRKKIILAANARPGLGGQGLNLRHMIEALGGDHDLTVMCQGSDHPGSMAVPPSRLSPLIALVPLLRRRRDWKVLSSDLRFDRWVAAHLPPAEVFQGVVGQCAESLEAARRRGLRTVLDVVNTHVDDFHGHVLRESRAIGLRHPVHPRSRERMLREYEMADLIRVMSRRAGRTFLDRGVPARKLLVATPPVDPARFPRARFDGPRFRVSFVGLIEPWKGFHHLLEAFGRLRLPEAELVLWGGSGSRAATRIIQGWQARGAAVEVRPVSVSADYAGTVATSSVLVHPSLADGFSYAVAEAMACGVPVIVTDNTGAADLVADGESGYVIRGGDVEALADRLRHLHANPSLLPSLGARAREAIGRLTPEAFRAPLLGAIAGLA